MGFFDDEEDEQAPVPEAPQQPLVGPGPARSSMADALMQKYAEAGNTKEVDDAKDQAYWGKLFSAIGEGAQGVALAPAVARGRPGVDHASWDRHAQSFQDDVARAEQRRQGRMKGVLDQHALQKQLGQEEVQSRQNDPKSQESVAFRDFLQKTYPDMQIPELSYAEAQKSMPVMINKYQAMTTQRELAEQKLQAMKDAAEQRRLIAQTSREQAQATRDAAKADRQDKDTNAQFDRLTDHIKGTVRDSIGAEKSKLRNTTHALSILDSYDNLDNLSPKQANEIGMAMASTITPGHPAESLVHNMTPKSAQSDLANALEYITGAPQSAGLGKQLSLYKHMLERQADTSREIIKGEIAPIVANSKHLRGRDRQRYDDIFQQAGVKVDDDGHVMAFEPAYINPTREHLDAEKPDGGTAIAGSGPVAPAASQHPQAGAAEQWARAHPKDPRAQEILKRLEVK